MNQENNEVDFKVDLSKPPVKEDDSKNVSETDNTAEETTKEPEVKEETAVAEESQEVKEEIDADAKADAEKEVENQDKEVVISKEEIIAEFLTNKYSMGLEELENVLSNKDSKNQELPEEVEKYLQFKNETKRGLKDFVKANEDISDYKEEALLREYYKQSNPELDDSDISFLIEDRFNIDESVDTDTDIKKKSLDKKQELHKAKQYFEQTREKYKAPLESSLENLPEEAKEAVTFYKQYNDEKSKEQEVINSQREAFEKKTSKFFGEEFKGFEFKIGDKTLNFKPKDKTEVVEKQMNLNNFIQSFLDDKGVLKDAKQYHTALNMAMNPEAYAKFFYEQGKADAVNQVVTDGKNIDMNVRTKVDSSKPGMKFKVVDSNNGFGSGLKIRKK
jgi:hypothetical protein